MELKIKWPAWLLLCAFSLLFFCSPNSHDELAGGSTGTEVSAVVGTIVNTDGSPAALVAIRLRPTDYIVDSSGSTQYRSLHSIFDTVTDVNGQFKIDSLLPGNYRIEAVNSSDTFGVLFEVNIATDTSVVSLPQTKLLPMAIITGEIQVNSDTVNGGNVQIYGVERSVTIDSNGGFRIRVPVGAHRLHIKTNAGSPVEPFFESMDVNLHVEQGEMRDIGALRFGSPQSKSCPDGRCDSIILFEILDTLEIDTAHFSSISEWQNGRIMALDFSGLQIQYLPKKIMKLSKVVSIDLGKTGIKDLFHEIGFMKNLNTLYLDSNMLENVPFEIGNLTNCRSLDLSGNKISSLPGSFTKLYPNVFLDLSGNRLCNLDSTMANWASRFDPDWKETQTCNQ
jgi:hypothetical protein